MKRLENFNSSVDDKYKWSNYSKLKNDKELVDRIKNVFQFIKTELSKEDEPFAQAMSNASFDLDNPNLLRNAIEFIDSIYEDIESEIEDKNQHFHDIQGDVYEHLLKHTSEAGKNGQFRTPRHIIHMMAGLLDPDLDGKILDLASGTGGFLVGAYQYLITKYSKSVEPDDDGLIKGTDGGKLNKSQRKKLEEETFYGFDIDRTMVRIGVMNLMMHGISKPHIVYLDSLSTAYEKWEADQLSVTLDSKDKKSLVNPKLQGQFKYILANPPFTGKIDSPGVSENLDRIYPPVYEDKEETKRKKQTVQSELLFLERMVYMLEEGGRAAVIVPEGVLFNSGKAHKRIRWFYGMDSDGYTLDSNRKRLKESPLPKVLEHWNNKKQENQSDRKLIHFSIPYEEIKDNGFELNFNLYKDFVYEPQEFEPSEKILKKISELELEINQGLEELRNF